MSETHYFYNKDGIRIKKESGGKETNYFVENSNIVYEEREEGVLFYKRTEENELVGISYQGKEYYYKKNNQNDIIGLYNSEYKQIASYTYDSYGKIISIKDANGKEITDQNHIAHKNPYRYRSYYYDEETGFYYLNSRYYNPEWGRFINTDSYPETYKGMFSNNVYLYVENNPINRTDIDGELWLPTSALVSGFIGGLVSFTVGATFNVINGEKFTAGLAGATVSGFLAGAIAATPFGFKKSGIATSIVGGGILESLINEIIEAKNENRSISLSQLALNTATSVAVGAITELVPTPYTINKGWFRPTSLISSITGNYQKKLTTNAITSNIVSSGISTGVDKIQSPAKNNQGEYCENPKNGGWVAAKIEPTKYKFLLPTGHR